MKNNVCLDKRMYRFVVMWLCALLLGLVSLASLGRAASRIQLLSPQPDHDTVTITAGQPVTFKITYKGADVPGEAYVDLMTPAGQKTQVKFPDSQRAAAVKGEPLITTYTPVDTGTFKYRFHVQAVGDVMDYPDGGEPREFNVRPNWFPYAVIAAGFFLSFLVISTLVYQVMHRGMGTTQHNSARVAIMIGGICWILSILYALDWLTNIIAWVAAGIVMLLLLVWAVIAR